MTEFSTEHINNPTITFGKHAGSKLSDIPYDYLVWLLEKAEEDSLTPKWLNGAVKREWEKRKPLAQQSQSNVSLVLSHRETCGCEVWTIISGCIKVNEKTYRAEIKGVELNYCEEHIP